MSIISESEAKDKAQTLASEFLEAEELSVDTASGGDSNYTFLVDEELVIKIERREGWSEEMHREPAVLHLLEDQDKVEVPKIIDSGHIDGLYYRIMQYLEGETLDKYSDGKNFHNLDEVEKKQVARSIGEKLAQVHRLKSFNRFGVLETNGDNIENISAENWSNGLSDLQNWWHKKLIEEGFEEITETSEKILEKYSGELNKVEESRLLHMEFDLRNILFQEDDIAVLDWEVTSAGDPLLDLIITEKRLTWLEQEDKEISEALRNGYSSVRDIESSSSLEELYEMSQMIRFLLIFRNDDEMRNRIENRLQELFDSLKDM